ncbi:MAG: DUF1552 domain-containing protein [Planctomycetota bacterium]|nr:DUF1552 domain-containing protein [Planctomycetota bacterium]MEC7719264.1 DUF1552 domain-containing protein [Planctomycetota bacterium]MED5577932.1 DUF1552 domain-containing protein [Planctomycetota bacterium]MEE3077121.1 DUF1552 domain-containing protein [Planctomycetota bacterium]
MNNPNSGLNRRGFLWGSGMALALPWLETFANEKEAGQGTPKRFVSIYHPDGVGLPLKTDPAWKDWSWFPRGGEHDFQLTKVLDVLEPLRQDITIYSGLSHPAARRVHGHSNADQYLTGADIGGHGPYRNTVSLDQVIAEESGNLTRHASLVMSTNGGIGGPRGAQTQSYNREGRPIPAMNKPKQIFDTLFVTTGKEAKEKLARSQSALDFLIENTRALDRKLSMADRRQLQQYMDAVRDTEIKLERAQKWVNTPIPEVDTQHLVLEAGPEEARLYFQTMYELIYLSFLSDSTRVATFQLGRENGEGPHDLLSKAVDLGKAHALTHDVKKPNGWQNLGTYNRYQASEFGRFVQKLRNTPEPDGHGNMLDNTFAMHGSASSSFHLSRNYPIISAGGKNLGFRNGRYLKFGTGNEDNQAGAGITTDSGWQSQVKVEEEPLAALFVTILQRMGIDANSFAGHAGTLARV